MGRTRWAIAAVAVVALAGCAAAGPGTAPDPSYQVRLWKAAEVGTGPRDVVLVFDGPDPGVPGCRDDAWTAVDAVLADRVEVSVRVARHPVPPGCPIVERRADVELPTPLGDRLLSPTGTDQGVRLVDGGFRT